MQNSLKIKLTHGECQMCGRILKLVQGRVARHGFKKMPGYGETNYCRGSYYAPVGDEKHVILLDREIEFAQRKIKENQADLTEMADPAHEWNAMAIPAKAIKAREEGIKSFTKYIASMTARRASILGR